MTTHAANGHERMTPRRALAIALLVLEARIETDADLVVVAELREARAVLAEQVKAVFGEGEA